MSITYSNKIVVHKVIVGRPIVSIIPSGANINDLQGIDFSDRVDGSVIVYNGDTGLWTSQVILQRQVIDGGDY
jgi:hypothetical protein